jgi:hypothetical protein
MYTKFYAPLHVALLIAQFYCAKIFKDYKISRGLHYYRRQFRISIRSLAIAMSLAAAIIFVNPVIAQPTFTQRTGVANPLDEQTVLKGRFKGSYPKPTFEDIDGNGTKDAIIGDLAGAIHFFKNTGTATAPMFVEQTGANNPFNAVSSGKYAAPAFADIDGDGKLDLFVGVQDGTIKYYKNTGTATAPVFTLQADANNPLSAVAVNGGYAAPAFVDIDNDGDQDVFIGSNSGDIVYYQNTGTASMPAFTEQTGANNPLNVNVGYYSSPTFVDIDLNGKKDAVVGIEFSSIIYYKNTGTKAAPVFTGQTGANNPFAAIAISSYGSPAFVDINNDGDPDAFFGDASGEILYYENTGSLLPLQLLSFSGNKQANCNELQWQTAQEINTKTFKPERSIDGTTFTEIGSVVAAGNGGNNYLFRDDSLVTGKVFYRLKMVDIDGRFTYSQVIWINSERTRVSIYPNPVTDVVNINTGDADLLKTIAGLYDVNGRLVKNILITNNQQQINVQQLPKGRYMIKFADGTLQSFVKE